jgi:hypothetical protein
MSNKIITLSLSLSLSLLGWLDKLQLLKRKKEKRAWNEETGWIDVVEMTVVVTQ